MNGTRWAISPEMNATSRERRHSFATSREPFLAANRRSGPLGIRLFDCFEIKFSRTHRGAPPDGTEARESGRQLRRPYRRVIVS
jgi:hypothetical protein